MILSLLRRFSVPLFAVTSTMLVGCTDNDESSSNDATQEGMARYLGTWESSCVQVSADQHAIEIFGMSENNFSIIAKIHEKADCSDEAAVAEISRVIGDYEETDTITTSDGLLAYQLNFIVKQIELVDGSFDEDSSLIGRQVLDITYVDDNDLLYFGIRPDFDDLNFQPTALDFDIVYSRQ